MQHADGPDYEEVRVLQLFGSPRPSLDSIRCASGASIARAGTVFMSVLRSI
jgi:hypothetical protein